MAKRRVYKSPIRGKSPSIVGEEEVKTEPEEKKPVSEDDNLPKIIVDEVKQI